MLRPPPQVKGSVTEEDILTFLPDVNTTCRVLNVLVMLSQPSLDYVSIAIANNKTRLTTKSLQTQIVPVSVFQ